MVHDATQMRRSEGPVGRRPPRCDQTPAPQRRARATFITLGSSACCRAIESDTEDRLTQDAPAGEAHTTVPTQSPESSASLPHRRMSLWRNRDFTAYWLGDTVSALGTQVTFVALPLVALVTLNVGAAQLGVLRFAEYLPFLAFTLFFGVWADRRRRRPLMLASYAVRGAMVALVPLLAVLGLLTPWLLAAIAFVIGTGAALFEVCWLTYVPSLVRHERLTEAMGKVVASHSAAEVAGPALGGLLVHVVTAPYALLLDTVSYAAGTLSLMRIRQQERDPGRPASPRRSVSELVLGLRVAFGEAHIRATAFSAALGNFFGLVTETAFLAYAVHDLRLSPDLIGVVLTAIGAGGLLGALAANLIIRRVRLGRVYVGSRTVGVLAATLMPLAAGPKAMVVAMCMASFFLVQAALAITNILSSTLRQVLTQDHIRGRMNASVRTVVYGTLSVGSLAGGILGDAIGLHATLWVGAAGYALSIVPILLSPIPQLRAMPAPADSVP